MDRYQMNINNEHYVRIFIRPNEEKLREKLPRIHNALRGNSEIQTMEIKDDEN